MAEGRTMWRDCCSFRKFLGKGLEGQGSFNLEVSLKFLHRRVICGRKNTRPGFTNPPWYHSPKTAKQGNWVEYLRPAGGVMVSTDTPAVGLPTRARHQLSRRPGWPERVLARSYCPVTSQESHYQMRPDFLCKTNVFTLRISDYFKNGGDYIEKN